VTCEPELRILVTELVYRVAGVASFILLADIGDQHLWAPYLDFESGDQRVFGVNDDVLRFSLKSKADRKLHPGSPLLVKGSIETLDDHEEQIK
jgi:hypothetical protein